MDPLIEPKVNLTKAYVKYLLMAGLSLFVALWVFSVSLRTQHASRSAKGPDASQKMDIEAAKASRTVGRHAGQGEIITREELESLPNQLSPADIFPKHLIYDQKQQVPDSQRESIALQQRISLLENQIVGLTAELDLIRQASVSDSISSEIGANWPTFFGIIVWAIGVIFTSIITHATERLILRKQ